MKETAAKEFLSSLRRQRRQLWDRSQPDVQQWYQQFLYLGFDEQVGNREQHGEKGAYKKEGE